MTGKPRNRVRWIFRNDNQSFSVSSKLNIDSVGLVVVLGIQVTVFVVMQTGPKPVTIEYHKRKFLQARGILPEWEIKALKLAQKVGINTTQFHPKANETEGNKQRDELERLGYLGRTNLTLTNLAADCAQKCFGRLRFSYVCC